ncbi:protein of unknown function [Tenacibaculum sp. 190130A14a]|uniref:Uncharacterized protein n=1 Tax=Tenacibaculum polynesiense TaxID=3137857 RepID=A0ABM9P7E5_9FLAO
MIKIIPTSIEIAPNIRLVVKASTGRLSQPYFPAIKENISCPHKPNAIIFDIPNFGIV